MNSRLAHLLNLLEDEFRGVVGVRVRPVLPSTTRRSPDLVQDYDPESENLHLRSGVRVQTGRHEYFFPEEWMCPEGRRRVESQIEEIRDRLAN